MSFYISTVHFFLICRTLLIMAVVILVVLYVRFAMMDQIIGDLVKDQKATLVVGPVVFLKYMQEPGDKFVPGR